MIRLSFSVRKLSFLFSLLLLNTFARSQNLQYSWATSVTGAVNRGTSIAVDQAGNVISGGNFSGAVTVDSVAGNTSFTSAGSTDVLLCKRDANGMLIWAKRWGGLYADRCDNVRTDAAGNIYVIGVFQNKISFDSITLTTSGLDYNVFMCKLDPAGNTIWAKQFNAASSLYTNAYSIALDAAGNIYVCGYFVGTVDFDPGPGTATLVSYGSNPDAFVGKFDANGNYQWVKQIGGIEKDVACDVTIDKAGNVYTVGSFSGLVDFNPDLRDSAAINAYYNTTAAFISKLNANGVYVWAKAFLPMASSMYPAAIALDDSGNIYTAGSFYGSVDFNPGTAEMLLNSAGSSDIWISKLNAAGNYVWAKQLGAAIEEQCTDMKVDAAGNVITTGTFFKGTSDFDPGTAKATLTSKGLDDIYISKLDAAGNYVFAKQIGGASADYSSSLAMDTAGNVYITGDFSGTTDFDPGDGIVNLSGTTNNTFVTKLINVPTLSLTSARLTGDGNHLQQAVISNNSNRSSVTVYPSPAQQSFTIQITDKALLHTPAVLMGASGTPAKFITINDFATRVNIGDLPSGMYVLQLANGRSIKIIHQQ